MRTAVLTAIALGAAAPLAAQSHAHAAGGEMDGGGVHVAGWHARLDRADANVAGVKFVAMGSGYHATTGPAAIFYDPSRTAGGEYRAGAAFTQTTAPEHPEAYGLFIGGKNLAADDQDYLYFLVRQNGAFLVKHRAGAETHTLVPWTAHAAVKQADAEGKATNVLTIEARAEGVRFLVNAVEVATLDRVPYLNTDGIVGVRINHRLDVHIGGIVVEPLGSASSGR